ncbi:glycosyltransferase family 2 protein [Candidatus Planktophila dulcis]|uniref:glycosyltransferase family 2 protein n=1 Tax=Candidatus Planktophila dulcis TaxID=1884914 RepID=UPI003CFA0DB9
MLGEAVKSASIICPVYKMAGKLQLFEEWVGKLSSNPQIEIIVVNDYSNEATSSELNAICQRYDNLKFIEGNFGNPGSARNAGLEICQGKWVTFWDSDDEPDVENFLALLKSIELTNLDICFGRYKIFNETSHRISESPAWSSNTDRDLSILAQNPGIWRIIFTRKLIEGIRFEALRMAEDQIFICEAILKARNFMFTNNQIYTYFTGSTNHLTKNSAALQDLLPAFKKTIEILKTSDVAVAPFLSLMAAKQLISGGRYGNMRTRFGLIVVFFKARLFVIPTFLNALRAVIQTSVRGA